MWVCRLPVHIGPLGSYEFAEDSRKKRCILPGGQGRPPLHSESMAQCNLEERADEGIGPYTDIQLKTFIHGMEVFNMKIIMRRDSVILSKSRNRLRQRRNLSD